MSETCQSVTKSGQPPASAATVMAVNVIQAGDDKAINAFELRAALRAVRAAAESLRADFANVPLGYHNVAAEVVQPLPTNAAAIFVFLLDSDFFSAAHAKSIASVAMQLAANGNAVIVPVLMNDTVQLQDSVFAFLSPVRLTNVKPGQLKLDWSAAVTEFLQRQCGETSAALPLPAHASTSLASQATTVQATADPLAASKLSAEFQHQHMMARVAGTTQIAEVVDPLPCHMGEYDDFVEQLIGKLQVMRMKDHHRQLYMYSEALRQVLKAEMVYCYFRGKKGGLHLFEAESNRKVHGCTSQAIHSVLEDALEGYADFHGARSLQLKNFLPQLAASQMDSIESMVVINHKLPNCGVFIAGKRNASRYPKTEIISTVVNVLHDYLASGRFENFEQLKALVYDELKNQYRYVSDDMYQDRLRIFSNQINSLGVQFEPIIQFDRSRRGVSVYAYEALARESAEAISAPVHIFDTASLWGTGFQSEVDKKLLEITLRGYSRQLQRSQISGQQIKPLSLNVYPATLRCMDYREMLYKQLAESTLLSGRNLIMEVSEKTVVSPEIDGESRRQLLEYRKLVQQITEVTGGVKFAIDDFGVGNASLSRLDSLHPNYVKIDRDILSFDRRMADTLIRYLIESQQERGTHVILEGVDIHSGFKLDELVNEMGVSLVQGYCLSRAVTDISPGWEQEVCDRARQQVGWGSASGVAATATNLH